MRCYVNLAAILMKIDKSYVQVKWQEKTETIDKSFLLDCAEWLERYK